MQNRFVKEIKISIKNERIKEIEQRLIKKTGINIKYFEIEDQRPEGARVTYLKNNNLVGIELNLEKYKEMPDLLHELIHGELWFLEDWPVLALTQGISQEEKELANLIVTYITEDPVVHRKIKNMGFNPINDIFFTGLNKDIRYLKKGIKALDAYDNFGEKVSNFFKICRYILTDFILKDFDDILDYGKRDKIKDFFSFFKSRFPDLDSKAKNFLELYNEFDINSKKGCRSILEKSLTKPELSTKNIKIAHYVKKNNHFDLENLN